MVPRRALWICVGLAVLAGTGEAPDANAQTRPLRIAVYAPWSGPSTADERHAFSLEIQAALDEVGQPAQRVSSFAKLADLRRALGRGVIDVVLCDASAIGNLGRRASSVATWSSKKRWVLAARSPGPLRGRSLALQASDATSSDKLVRLLLRGQLPKRYWSAVVGAPVTADARQLVVRGKADVVVVPKADAAGLTELADLGTFSELALVAVTVKAPAREAVASIQGAVVRRFGGAWSKSPASFPRSVALTRVPIAPPAKDVPHMLQWLAKRTPAVPALAPTTLWITPDAP